MHRFIPAILKWKGFKIGEIKVRHRPRMYGRTKYSAKRIVKGFLDLLVVKFWAQYSTRPIHLFGGSGMVFAFIGTFMGVYLVFLKFAFNQPLANRPLLLFAVLLIVIGIQFFMFGLLADIMVKNIYQKERPYKIEEIIG